MNSTLHCPCRTIVSCSVSHCKPLVYDGRYKKQQDQHHTDIFTHLFDNLFSIIQLPSPLESSPPEPILPMHKTTGVKSKFKPKVVPMTPYGPKKTTRRTITKSTAKSTATTQFKKSSSKPFIMIPRKDPHFSSSTTNTKNMSLSLATTNDKVSIKQQNVSQIREELTNKVHTKSISNWNSNVRNKTSPIFQQNLQYLFAVSDEFKCELTDQDFVNPVPSIRKVLLEHGLIISKTNKDKENGEQRPPSRNFLVPRADVIDPNDKNWDFHQRINNYYDFSGQPSTTTTTIATTAMTTRTTTTTTTATMTTATPIHTNSDLFDLLDFFQIFEAKSPQEIEAGIWYEPASGGDDTGKSNDVFKKVASFVIAAGGFDFRNFIIDENTPGYNCKFFYNSVLNNVDQQPNARNRVRHRPRRNPAIISLPVAIPDYPNPSSSQAFSQHFSNQKLRDQIEMVDQSHPLFIDDDLVEVRINPKAIRDNFPHDVFSTWAPKHLDLSAQVLHKNNLSEIVNDDEQRVALIDLRRRVLFKNIIDRHYLLNTNHLSQSSSSASSSLRNVYHYNNLTCHKPNPQSNDYISRKTRAFYKLLSLDQSEWGTGDTTPTGEMANAANNSVDNMNNPKNNVISNRRNETQDAILDAAGGLLPLLLQFFVFGWCCGQMMTMYPKIY